MIVYCIIEVNRKNYHLCDSYASSKSHRFFEFVWGNPHLLHFCITPFYNATH